MPTSGDLKSGDFFSDQHSPPPPDRVRQYDPYPLPHWAISRENSIYQGLQVVEYSSNQTLAYIGVTKKKSLIFVCNEQLPSRKKMKPETVIQA